MITQPSAAELLRTVRRELLEVIAPAVNGEKLSVSIQMMATLLYVAAQRADGEIGWMREEADEIDSMAAAVLVERPDASALSEAHRRYLDERTAAWSLPAVRADYDRASETLSTLLEEGLRSGDVNLRDRAEWLLNRRLAREQEIVGDSFQAAGR